MAIISVEVSDSVAKKFKPYTIIKYEELIKYNPLEDEMNDTDDEKWETIVDFGKGVLATEVLSYLKKINKPITFLTNNYYGY